MREEIATVHRLSAFSDAVIAVVITIMVLELKAPDNQSLSELWSLWPTAISYAVSYLFIAITWINHHYLMRFVDSLTPKLIWINFTHFVHGVTAAFCNGVDRAHPPLIDPSGVFRSDLCVRGHRLQCVRAEIFAQAEATKISERAQCMARRRSLTALGIFTSAMLVAFVAPRFAFGLVCGALILHLRPEAPGIFGGLRMSKRLTEVLKRIPG